MRISSKLKLGFKKVNNFEQHEILLSIVSGAISIAREASDIEVIDLGVANVANARLLPEHSAFECTRHP